MMFSCDVDVMSWCSAFPVCKIVEGRSRRTDIQKELAVESGEAPTRFFPGLKREALVTIISADMQLYANFACGDARHVSSMPTTRHVRR
jgi:hypothetical protein